MRGRWPAVPLVVASATLLVQSLALDTWGMFGPGPGLFPISVSALCCVLSLALLAWPRIGVQGRESAQAEEAAEAPLEPAERRTFLTCVAALLLLAATALIGAGLIVMCVLTTLTITWFGERRSWRRALVFGILCALAGLVVFNRLLGVDVPSSPVETWLVRLTR